MFEKIWAIPVPSQASESADTPPPLLRRENPGVGTFYNKPISSCTAIKMKHTQLSSARNARRSQMVVFLHAASHAPTAPPRLMNVLYIWNAVSLLSKTSVRLCQNAGVSGTEGESPTSGP